MIQSSLPEHWQELLAGYALGNLSPEEAEELQHLLDTNPDLSAELNHFQAVLDLVPDALPDPNLPLPLRTTILTAAQSSATSVFPSDRSHSRSRSLRFSLTRMGAAVAAVLALALAIDNYRLRQTVQTNEAIITSLQQPDAQFFVLRGTENAVTASGSLVVTPTDQAATVLVQNLPPLPSGEAYRLWAIAAGRTEPTFCGQFNPQSSQTAVAQWTIPAEVCSTNVSQMLITAESIAAPPIPAGPLVLESEGGGGKG